MQVIHVIFFDGIFAHWFDWCYFTQRNCPRRRCFHVWWRPFDTENEAHWNVKRQCSATVQCAGYFCRPLEGWANVEPCGVTWYWRCSERKSAQTKFVIETMARWNIWLGPWRWTPCWSSMPRPDLSSTCDFHAKLQKHVFSRRLSMPSRPWLCDGGALLIQNACRALVFADHWRVEYQRAPYSLAYTYVYIYICIFFPLSLI